MPLAHRALPDPSSFQTKTSRSPAAVRFVTPGPGSKSTVLVKNPVTPMLPDASTATPLPAALEAPDPGAALAQRKAPAPLSFATKASLFPPATRVVDPKVTDSWNVPT